MQPVSGIGPHLVRLLHATAPDLLSELLTPGKVLEAEVVSVFQDRAMLSFGRGARLEVVMQAPLREGQKVLVQVQLQQPDPPTPQQGARPHTEPPAVVLKVLPRESAPATGQTTSMTAMTAKASLAEPQSARLTLPLSQSAQTSQPAPAQAQSPQVMWLPIPLPDGQKGWVQLQVEEEGPRRARRNSEGAQGHQVRVWWQTPALGAIQVTLDNSRGLSALFTVAEAESRTAINAGLPDLRHALAEAGFPDVRTGVRQPAPGESVEPVKLAGQNLLDRRM